MSILRCHCVLLGILPLLVDVGGYQHQHLIHKGANSEQTVPVHLTNCLASMLLSYLLITITNKPRIQKWINDHHNELTTSSNAISHQSCRTHPSQDLLSLQRNSRKATSEAMVRRIEQPRSDNRSVFSHQCFSHPTFLRIKVCCFGSGQPKGHISCFNAYSRIEVLIANR